METFQPAKYSFNWAFGIVQRVREKHPRATDFVEEVLDISDRNLAKYVANGDKLWPDLRNLIKNVAKLAEDRFCVATEADLYYSVIMYCRSAGKSRLYNRLTAIGFEPTLKEQVERGVPEGLLAEGTQPSVLEDGYVQYTLF